MLARKTLYQLTRHHYSANLFKNIAPKIFSELPEDFNQNILFKNNRCIPPQEFATHFKAIEALEHTPNFSKIKQVQDLNRASATLLKEKYPNILSFKKPGLIIYTLRSTPPEEFVSNGGFTVRNLRNLDVYWNAINGNNYGNMCFSFLPEVATIFEQNKALNKKIYLYATPLSEQVQTFLPGGKWRQIISPGSFPKPETWFVREIKKIENSVVELGPMMGQLGNNLPIIAGEKFEDFCNNTIKIPKELDYGEDFPLEFEIFDTENTLIIEAAIKNFYEKIPQLKRNSP